jgi:hypothetical protein
MVPIEEASLVEQLQGLERAFHGLSRGARFDETLADCQTYVKDRLAAIILSDELKIQIDGLELSRDRALVTQQINEMTNHVFERPDYCHDWEQNRQWLGDAIILASQLMT